MDKDSAYKEVETGLPAERVLDVAATAASLVPLIGGPVAAILSGISGGRKEQRILQVILDVSDDLRGFKSQAAEDFVDRFAVRRRSRFATCLQIQFQTNPSDRRLLDNFPNPPYDVSYCMCNRIASRTRGERCEGRLR